MVQAELVMRQYGTHAKRDNLKLGENIRLLNMKKIKNCKIRSSKVEGKKFMGQFHDHKKDRDTIVQARGPVKTRTWLYSVNPKNVSQTGRRFCALRGISIAAAVRGTASYSSILLRAVQNLNFNSTKIFVPLKAMVATTKQCFDIVTRITDISVRMWSEKCKN